MIKSCLNIDVSCFANYFETGNSKPVNLLKWLQSDKYKAEVEKIRAIADKKERDKIKATLPAITPSALLKHRKKNTTLAEKLNKYSGLMQFDIDFKENTHIENWTDLKSEIMNWKNIAYCELSVSGTGFWGLIPIAHPEKIQLHYKAVCEEFKSFGINLDVSKGGNATDLRGYSYDADAKFNHNAETYYRLFQEPKPQTKKSFHSFTTIHPHSSERIRYYLQKIETAPDGQKHEALCRISYYFGGLAASGILQEHEAIENLKSAIRSNPNNVVSLADAYKTIEKCFTNGLKEPIQRQNYIPVHVRKCDLNKNEFQSDLKAWDQSPTNQNSEISLNFGIPINKKFEPQQSIYSNKATREQTPEVLDLIQRFESVTLPEIPIQLNQCSKIINVNRFVQSHLYIIKENIQNKAYQNCIERLITVKNIIRENLFEIAET